MISKKFGFAAEQAYAESMEDGCEPANSRLFTDCLATLGEVFIFAKTAILSWTPIYEYTLTTFTDKHGQMDDLNVQTIDKIIPPKSFTCLYMFILAESYCIIFLSTTSSAVKVIYFLLYHSMAPLSTVTV